MIAINKRINTNIKKVNEANQRDALQVSLYVQSYGMGYFTE